MPRANCLEVGCGSWAVYRGRCRVHAREAEAEVGRARSVYDTKRWKLLRAKVLRVEPLCRQCGELATEVDHVIPIRQGGEVWRLSNLQPLCKRHHSIKTRAEQDAPASP